jgi:predicted HicB family RNase H-like nuclease
MTAPADTATMSIRLPADLYEKLRRAAFEQRTSMNALIVEAIRTQQIAAG